MSLAAALLAGALPSFAAELHLSLDARGPNSGPSQTVQASSTLPTSSPATRERFFDANVSTEVLLPIGATASASFTNLWSQDTSGGPLSRFAQPDPTLSFSQPLLQ